MHPATGLHTATGGAGLHAAVATNDEDEEAAAAAAAAEEEEEEGGLGGGGGGGAAEGVTSGAPCPDAALIAVGAKVELHGLSRPELNGRRGTVTGET